MILLRKKIRTGLSVSLVLFLCILLARPEEVMEGATEGLRLWYQIVLPAQLPFVIGINILLRLGINWPFPPAAVCVASGLISGFPVGSVTAGHLYHGGAIARREFTPLAAFSNLAGPGFIVGTVGIGLLKSAKQGYILLAAQWVTAIGLSLFATLWHAQRVRIEKDRDVHKSCAEWKKKGKKKGKKAARAEVSMGQILGDSVGEAAELMLKVAGFIVLFSVILQWVPAPLGAFLEMTNGLKWAAGLEISLDVRLAVLGFLLGFSGVCVVLQSLAATQETEIQAGRFLVYKLLQGLTAAGMTWGFCQILGL